MLYVIGLFCLFYLLPLIQLHKKVSQFRQESQQPLKKFNGAFPGISIITSIKGPTPFMKDGISTLISQDYAGPIELIIAAKDENEILLPECKALTATVPKSVNVKYVYPVDTTDLNPRTAKLAAASALATHPWIFITCVDTRFHQDFFTRAISEIQADPKKFATAFPVIDTPEDLPAKLEAIGLNIDVSLFFMFSKELREPFAYGGALLFHESLLEAVGGWPPFLKLLTDDITLAQAFTGAGAKGTLVPSFAYVKQPHHSFKGFWSRAVRWRMIAKYFIPRLYMLSPMGWPVPLAFIYSVLFMNRPVLVMTTLTFIIKAIIGGFIQKELLTPQEDWKKAWVLPIYDISSLFTWTASLFKNEIQWGTTKMRLDKNGAVYKTKIV